MKTIPLSELLAKATPGPYKWGEDWTEFDQWNQTDSDEREHDSAPQKYMELSLVGGSGRRVLDFGIDHWSPECDPYTSMRPVDRALLAHAANHIGPLVEALEEVLAYRRGIGKYNFSSVPFEDRGIVQLEAWQAIETKLDAALAAAKNVEVGP